MRFLFSLFLMLAVAVGSPAAHAYKEIDNTISGSWYNAVQPGHGFSFQIMTLNQIVVYWYVYNFLGKPMWLVGVGDYQGNTAVVTFYYVEGMVFGDFNPDDNQQQVWGTGVFELYSCDTGFFEYASDFVADGESFGSGGMPIDRLSSISGLEC